MSRIGWYWLVSGAIAAIFAPWSSVRAASDVDGDAIAQIPGQRSINSVDDLSDVPPGHWARSALDDLIRDYGCIAGYPDGTYRGNRTLTRYEFAAALDACVDAILGGVDSPELPLGRIEQIERLQEEFAAELATLRGRVDSLEERVQFLEDHQFSTTTQLRGEVSFALSSLFGEERADGEDLEEVPVFNNRVRLFFNTSFTGDDLLITRLDALNVIPFGPGEGDDPDITGTSMTRTAFDEGSDNSVRLGKLFYTFAFGESGHSHHGHSHDDGHGHGHHGHGAEGDLSFMIDAVGGEFNENFANFNEFFSEELTGSISRFGRFNPIYYQGLEGTGASVSYRLGDFATLSAGYLAPDANDPQEKNGLFNGSYAAMGQLALTPSDDLRFGLTYVRSYFPGDRVVVSGETGSELANVPFGEDTATSADNFGFQTSLRIADGLNISGWAGLTRAHAETDGFNDEAGVFIDEGDNATIFNWAVTLAFPDLGSEGSLGGIVIGQPPKVTDNDSGPEDEDTSWHLEAQYRYQLNDNIAINPGFFVILNPEHNDDRDAIWVGTIRTIFEF
mgnify:CR=1 FL=1